MNIFFHWNTFFLYMKRIKGIPGLTISIEYKLDMIKHYFIFVYIYFLIHLYLKWCATSSMAVSIYKLCFIFVCVNWAILMPNNYNGIQADDYHDESMTVAENCVYKKR